MFYCFGLGNMCFLDLRARDVLCGILHEDGAVWVGLRHLCLALLQTLSRAFGMRVATTGSTETRVSLNTR